MGKKESNHLTGFPNATVMNITGVKEEIVDDVIHKGVNT